nr:probable E3 ubiquitin-protein ligase TRIM8 [Paramormyrops kingsleyae]
MADRGRTAAGRSPRSSLSAGWPVCPAALRFSGSQSVIQLSEHVTYPKLLVLQKSFRTIRETVELRYRKMQELLMWDMDRTLQKLDAAHSRFCAESSAQILRLSKTEEDTMELLSSVQMALQKTEDVNFMKDTASFREWLNRSESNISRESPLLSQANFEPRHFLVEVSKNLQNLLEGPPSTSTTLSQSKLGTTRAEKRKFSMAFSESDMGAVTKQRCTT